MRKLVYLVATTVDGFIAHENGSVEGFLMDGDHVTDYTEMLKSYDSVVMGKATYEFGYQFGLKPGYAPYPHMDHYIFSREHLFETSTDSRVHLVKSDPVSFIAGLKQQEGTSIYLCGGGKFAGFLLKNRMIDELIVKVNPVIFGKGIPVFENLDTAVSMELNHTKTYGSGVVFMTYAVKY